MNHPLQAIETRFLGATNYRGARIKASCQADSVTIPYSYEGAEHMEHWRAAQKLIEKMNWPPEGWNCGGIKTGYVFVRVAG